MCAIPTAAVVEAGGEPGEVEAGVRRVKGRPKRVPAVSLAGADLIAFVPTKDMTRARPFYEKTLARKLEGSSPVASAFRNAVLLRLIAVEQLTPTA